MTKMIILSDEICERHGIVKIICYRSIDRDIPINNGDPLMYLNNGEIVLPSDPIGNIRLAMNPSFKDETLYYKGMTTFVLQKGDSILFVKTKDNERKFMVISADRKESLTIATTFNQKSKMITFDLQMEYPNAKKENWPSKAKLSKGEIKVMNGVMGKITSDGLRGYICTVCGNTVTEAHHIKPEQYTIIYKSQEFYAERHVCDPCMIEHESKSVNDHQNSKS